MKALYQCEKCGRLYENPNEAVLCEEKDAVLIGKSKFKVGEKAFLASPSYKGEYLEPVEIKEVIFSAILNPPDMFHYLLSGNWGTWPERSLRKC